MPAILQVTDGTTEISLLRGEDGFCLQDWQQNVLQYKDDGVWQDSTISDERQLAMSKYANIVDVFIAAAPDSSQDLAIEDVQELARLLEKGANYWKTEWQQESVWIKAQASQESNPRYTIVKSWKIPQLNNPYSQPFLQPGCRALFNEINIEVEHGPWLEWPPSSSPCESSDNLTETQTDCFPSYLDFDGAGDDVNCGSAVSTDDIPGLGVQNDEITAEAWVRTSSYGSGNAVIVTKGSNLNPRWMLYINSGQGLRGIIECVTQIGVSASGLDEYSADGEWHHVLMTYSQGGSGGAVARTIYLAIDGTWVTSYAVQTVTIGNYTTDAADDLIIGNEANGNWDFDGDIGWVRVSDNVRYDPASNFTPEARCELPDIDSNTVVQVIYEGTGSTTYDRSGNDNDGTITGATWGCDCTITNSDTVDCNCIQASAEQTDWSYEAWAVDDAQPTFEVELIELTQTSGRMLASDDGEVWRTDDGGATAWVASTVPPNMRCYGIIEDPSTGYIYVAGRDTVGANNEVWRSTDAGVNWTIRNAVNGSSAHHPLAIDSQNRLILGDNDNGGIYRSDDGGTTWTLLTGQADRVPAVLSSGVLLSGSGSGPILRSIDNGATWDIVLNTGGATRVIREISGFVYVSRTGGELWRSGDAGATWEYLGDAGNATGSTTEALLDIILASNGLFYSSTGDGVSASVIVSTDGVTWKNTGGTGIFSVSLIEYSGNNRIYVGDSGDIYIQPQNTSIGRGATCLDESLIANKQNIAQLTHVTIDNGGVYVDQFPASVFPYALLPDPFAAGDAVYFGVQQSVNDSGPFSNLIFDIRRTLQVTGANTIRWEYWNGANWVALNVSDETAISFPFELAGVRSVTWVPPDDWTVRAVNGVTAWWVRMNVNVLGTFVQSPQQQNRDVYTVNWPRVGVDDLQVLGDIPALLRIKAHNRSDEDAYDTVDELDLLDNRMVIGLRSLNRGTQFTAFINTADGSIVANTYSQNPIGITVTDGTGTTTASEIHAPSGIAAVHTTQGNGIGSYDDAVDIAFGSSISRDYYGEFHAYVRAQLYEPSSSPSGDHDDVRVRLKLQTGSGGIIEYTEWQKFVGFDAWDAVGGLEETYKDYQLLDFDKIRLPVSSLFRNDELPDEFNITIQVASVATTNLRVEFYDLVLIPTDEWAGDFVDTALEDDSGVSNGYLLDIDSVSFPKRKIRTSARSDGATELIKSAYQSITASEAILQANSDQRLWFLAARGVALGTHTGANGAAVLTDSYADFIDAGVKTGMIVYNVTDGSSATITAVTQTTITGTLAGGAQNDWDTGEEYFIVCPNWRSEPWVVHSIQLTGNARYVAMRGNR